MSLKRIAIVGAAGSVGKFILTAVKSNPAFDVTVITRKNSPASFDGHTGVNVLRVADEYPDGEMVDAFRGQDAVVLSLGFAGQHRLTALAQASVKAGVKRLVASGYGVDPHNVPAQDVFPVASSKAAMIKDLVALETPGWSWSNIACGTFFDQCLQYGFYGIKPAARTAEIWDDGNARWSTTTRQSVGIAVAGILASPQEAVNRTVYISSTELSMNELLAAEQQVSGTKPEEWTVTHVDTYEEIPKAKEAVRTATEWLPRMMATARLGLAVNMKPEFGSDFQELGLLENDKFGVPRERLEDLVVKFRKG